MAVYVNTASKAQLASGITSGATSVTLASFTGWPLTFPFYAIINRGSGSAEIVAVTGGAGSTLTIDRAQGGTLASSHNGGEFFEHVVPAEVFTAFEAHMAASTDVHGVSGSVVGTSGAQTLTDKTYRGGHSHLFADALPGGLSAGFEVAASTAIARDGFKVSNTGADNARRAFLLEQSGSPRHEVFQDGTVKTTPNSAHTRPGQEVNTAAAKPAVRVTNTGAGNATTFEVLGNGNTSVGGTLGVTGTADVAGKSTLSGQAELPLQPALTATARLLTRTRPTQNAWESKDESGVNTLVVSAGGNLDASGYVAAAGAVSAGTNLSAAGTLAVTGASTLTGDVSLPVPGAGTTTRIVSRARTGGRVFEGRNQSDVATLHIKETGELVSSGKAFIHNGSSPVVAVINDVANVPSPSNSMVALDNVDKLVKFYNGSTWDVVGRYGTSGYVRYRRTTDQSIPNNTITKLNFTTADVTDTGIVTVAGGTDFTLVRGGLYVIEVNAQHEQDTSGSRWLFVAAAGDSTIRYAVDTNNPNNAAACAQQVFCLRRFAAGTVLSAYTYQDTGVTNPLTGSLPALCPMHINIAYMGP